MPDDDQAEVLQILLLQEYSVAILFSLFKA